MKIITRILIGFFLIYIIGFYFLVDSILNEIRPRYLETVEESLNDTAHLIASSLELNVKNNSLHVNNLKDIFSKIINKKLSSQIYGLYKTDVSLHVYVTNDKGIVIYDSNNEKNIGKDFSKWNDVYRTLRGKYGARSSRSDENDPSSSSLYVAAPIKLNNQIIGVITVAKPTDSVTPFIEIAKEKVITAGLVTCVAFIFLTALLSIWINRPIMKLTNYVKSLKTYKRLKLPALGQTEIRDLGLAFEEILDELEGKKYIENYIQALTHELKSPLSSIRGSAELLEDDMCDNMSTEQKNKFCTNILTETQRIETIIDKLLQLSAIESRKQLKDIEKIDLFHLTADIIESFSPQIIKKQITLNNHINKTDTFKGEKFLIRHALANLLQNAIHFSSVNGDITISSKIDASYIYISIIDDGEGIPSFAEDKIFDKFYSLPQKENQKKSTGLGLPFVKEAASLHGGWITVKNNGTKGVTAMLCLPLEN